MTQKNWDWRIQKLLHKNLSYDKLLQKVNFFLLFWTRFGVQAVHEEEKVRKGAYAHFNDNLGFLKPKV